MKFWLKEYHRYGIKADAQDFFNIIEPCLLKELPDEVEIIDVIMVGQLHAILRIVPKLCLGIIELWNKEEFFNFLLSINCDPEAFQIGHFVGAHCVRILENLDSLEFLAPAESKKFITALRKFNNVRESSLGNKLLPCWETDIEEFKNSFAELVENFDQSVFNKIHMVVDHIPQIVKRKKSPLSIFSEHVGETVHGQYWPYFEKTKVKLPKHWPVQPPPPPVTQEEASKHVYKKLKTIAEAVLKSTAEFNADNLKDYSNE